MAQRRLQFLSQTRRFLLLICTMTSHIVSAANYPKAPLIQVESCLSDTEMTTRAIDVTSAENPSKCARDCFRRSSCVSHSVQPIPGGGVKCYFYNHTTPASSHCEGNGAKHYNMVNGKCSVDNGIYNSNNGKCECKNSYVGDECHRLMKDCREGYDSGHYRNKDGVYQIHPATSPTSFPVYCQMWQAATKIQVNTGNHGLNFNRNWKDYRNGFGNVKHDYWLGLEKIYHLTRSGDKTLLVYVFDGDSHRTRKYYNYTLGSESHKYNFSYSSVSVQKERVPNMVDCLQSVRYRSFSTPDSDNDHNPKVNRAAEAQAGWWFGLRISDCNLNGNTRIQTPGPTKPGCAYWGRAGVYILTAELSLH